MKNLRSITLLLGFILFIASCAKEDSNYVAPDDPSLAYFPIDSGLTRYYMIDSVYWDEFTGTNDTVSYELKEVIAGTFIDNEGRLAQRLERFRKDTFGNWIIHKVWSSHRNNFRAEKVEDNIRIVKLTFPCSTGVSWNGYAYNTKEPQKFEFLGVGIPGSTSNLNFLETVRVLQDDEPFNLLYDNYSEEDFAKNIGMYYRINSYLEFDIVSGDTTSGYIYTEKLTSYSQ